MTDEEINIVETRSERAGARHTANNHGTRTGGSLPVSLGRVGVVVYPLRCLSEVPEFLG